jgi:hypothetical protein
MKYLDLSNVSATAQAPFLKLTGDHLNSALDVLSKRISQIVPSSWSGDVVFLYGDPKGSAIVAFNGQVYDYEGIGGVLDTDYFVIVNSFDAGDPVQYSDGNNYSQHKKTVLKTQTSSTGSTGVQVFQSKFIERIIADTDYSNGVLPISTSTVTGNQFKLNAANTLGDCGVLVRYRIFPMLTDIKKTASGGADKLILEVDVKYCLKREKDANTIDTGTLELNIDFSNIIDLDWLYETSNQSVGSHIVSTTSAIDGSQSVMFYNNIATAYVTGNILVINPASRQEAVKNNAVSIIPLGGAWTAGSIDVISGNIKCYIGIY